MQWFGYLHPWIFTGCLETPASDLPSVIALSQLPSGADAPMWSHTSTQKAPWVQEPAAAAILLLLCQMARATCDLGGGPAVGVYSGGGR